LVAMDMISNKTAIVGIGISEFSKDSGKTELRMASEVIREALDDAGLVPPDIDGIVVHTDDASDEIAAVRTMGMGNLTFFGQCRWDGAPCGMVMRAAIGVAAGMANYVLVYRAVNGSSKRRMGTPSRDIAQMSTSALLQWTFHAPFGQISAAGAVAMITSRYLYEYGIDPDKFGWIPVVCRGHGSKNPRGMYYGQPIAIEDYRRSPMFTDPLRLLDCHENSDAAAALIITTLERAKDLRQKPVRILAVAQSEVAETEEKNCFYSPRLSELPEIVRVGERLFAMSGLAPRHIRSIQLDDSYAPLVPMQLEALGFCAPGEGAAFCEGGDRIRMGGEIPLNTSGGSLGEGYLYGLNHIIEAVRLVRGTSPVQAGPLSPVLVTTGALGPASGLIVGDGL